MADNHKIVRQIYGCIRCAAMTPDYCTTDTLSTASQITFHERCWQTVDGTDLQDDRAALAGLVASLRPHLGDPTPGSAVFEIGAGRGALLRALRDAGYAAYGCEPAPALVAIAREHYSLGEDVLRNIDVEQMLQSADDNCSYRAAVLWHVVEHLHSPLDILTRVSKLIEPNGVIIIQVPFLKSDYIFPQHYYFCSHASFTYIAEKIGFSLAKVIYDEDNIYATAVFLNSEGPVLIDFLDYDTVPDALSQVIILNERSTAGHRTLINELTDTNRRLNSELVLAGDAINDRDIGLAAWRALAEDRLIAMDAMERLINDGLGAIAAQALLIDESNAHLALLRAELGTCNASGSPQATGTE